VYKRQRRGHRPSPEQLDHLIARYEAIGGTSPLTERTRAQVAGLAALLEAEDPGRYVVSHGAKHTEPSVERAATELAGRGVSAMVGIVLKMCIRDRIITPMASIGGRSWVMRGLLAGLPTEIAWLTGYFLLDRRHKTPTCW